MPCCSFSLVLLLAAFVIKQGELCLCFFFFLHGYYEFHFLLLEHEFFFKGGLIPGNCSFFPQHISNQRGFSFMSVQKFVGFFFFVESKWNGSVAADQSRVSCGNN